MVLMWTLYRNLFQVCVLVLITNLHHLLFGLGYIQISFLIPDQPLSMETGPWSGAAENPSIVADLLQEEFNEGWIEEVLGGEAELKKNFPHAAIGNMNVVLAPNRSPRLVVDSSISGVTAHTSIPNCMCLPRISDHLPQIACPPDVRCGRYLSYIGQSP